MDPFELLIRTGLSKKEAAIYAALLEHGTLSLSEISKHTHINRPALYTLLPKMQLNNLVSCVQRQKRTFYAAASAEHLVEQYEKDHADTVTHLKEIAKQQKHAVTDKPIIKYFEGQKGINFVFDDVGRTLSFGDTFYRYTSRTGEVQSFKDTYYRRMRDAKKIQRLVIANKERAQHKTKKLDRFLKVIPEEFDLFKDNISLIIYGEKTAYLDYSSNTAFIIESPKIARFQEKLFKLLYKKL